jgi:hypothetical protein
MAALTIAQRTLSFPPPGEKLTAVIGYILTKYEVTDPVTGTVPDVEKIFEDAEMKKLIVELGNEPEKKKVTKKKKSDEERLGEYECIRCDARIWKEKPLSGGLGYDNIQCSSKKVGGCNNLCKKHFKLQQEGNLWTGLITEARPENPVHPTAGPKQWSTDAEGNEVVKERKKKTSTKKSVPKKPKKSTKVSPEDMDLEELTKHLEALKLKKKDQEAEVVEEEVVEVEEAVEVEEVVEESEPEPEPEPTTEEKHEESPEPEPEPEPTTEEKHEESPDLDVDEDSEDEEDCYFLHEEEGVEYQINKDDMSVIRVEDFRPVGTWDEETKSIIFDEEE